MPVYIGTYQVGRQQVRGELDAVKIALDGFGQGFYRGGLGQSGQTLNQQVAITDQAHQHAVYQPLLADYPGRDMRAHRIQFLSVCALANRRCFLFRCCSIDSVT